MYCGKVHVCPLLEVGAGRVLGNGAGGADGLGQRTEQGLGAGAGNIVQLGEVFALQSPRAGVTGTRGPVRPPDPSPQTPDGSGFTPLPALAPWGSEALTKVHSKRKHRVCLDFPNHNRFRRLI